MNRDEDPLEKWERDLQDDAVWKRIQRNTFTRWANNHINSVNKHIEDLEQDLSDGLRLIALIEVLSGKRINRFNKRPTVRAQKIENIGIVLRFLGAEEKIRIVNIDGADLVDSNLKLILGLIWTLILHYSISTPFWEGEEDELDEKGNKKKETPKHRLLRWINNKLPELRINNFTSDWNSGIALAALVDAIAPGLFPNWEDLKKEDALLTAQKALALAEKWLGCPQLITAEDLVNPKVDELSVMTYLSNFPNAKIKEGCPVKIFSKSNPNRVRVYNIKDTVCNAPTTFTVETFSAGEGKLEVKVLDPKGKEITVKSVFNEDRSKTYTCTYVPKIEGQHKVVVLFNGKEVPKSPFTVQVQGVKGDPNKVKVEGVKDGQVNKPSQFDVDISEAGLGQVEVAIIDLADNKPCNIPLRIVPIEEPSAATEQQTVQAADENKKQPAADQQKSRRQKEQQPELVKPSQRKASKEEIKVAPVEGDVPIKFKVEYVPQKAGPHQIQVKFAGENAGAPYKVNFAPPCDLTKVKASGKGLWSLRVGDTADFHIFTEGAGQGKLQVNVQDPNGKNIPVEMRRVDLDSKAAQKSTIKTTQSEQGPVYSDNATGGTYECIYKPDQIGKYNVIIQYGDQEILRSPFEVNVSKAIESNIIAYGPGLKGGIVNSKSVFTVDTRGDDSTLAFSIKGPSQAKIECKDNGDGSAVTSYLPTAPGEYLIHVLSNGEDIPDSPYVAQILPRTDYNPELVEVRGKGVQASGVARNVPVKFEVDSTKAGVAPTEILVMNATNLKNIPVKCEKRRRSSVDLAGGQKKELESKTKKSKTTSGPVKQDSTEKKEEGDIIDCVYTTADLGKHVVQVNFGGVAVPNSPFIVNVGEQGQPNKVKVSGPGVENGIVPGTKTQFDIDAREAGVGEITATVDELKNGKKVPINLINNGNDTYKVEYNVDYLSSYRVDVSLDGKSVHNMPVTVRAAEPLNTKQIKILKLNNTAYLNTPNTFLVDTRGLKDQQTPIQVKCEVKSKSGKQQQAKVEKLDDGTHLVTFKPTEKGETQLNVLCDNQAATEKPLTVNVEEGFDEKKISVYGKNLKNGVVNEFNEFTIDTRNAGFANLNLAIEGPEDCEMTCTDNEDGTFLCKYKPEVPGEYKIEVKFGNKEVPNSPFSTNVTTKVDLDKIKLTGPGVDSKNPIPASIPTHIDINTKDAGKCRPDVQVQDPEGNQCKVKVEEKENGIYRVEYTPDEIGKYQVTCNFNSLPMPNSPISVNSVPTGNASKCVLKEELEKLIKAGKENCVTINAKEAGKGNVTCKISNLSKPKQTKKDVKETNKKDVKTSKKVKKIEEEEEDETIKVRVKDNKDGTFSVYYKVEEPGEYKMDLKFGGQHIPNGIHSFKVVKEEEEIETTTTTTKKKTGNKADQEEETTTNSTKTTKKRTVIKTESYEEETTTTTEYRVLRLRNLPLPKITHSKKQVKKDENLSSTLNELIGIVKLPNGEQDKVNIIDNRNNTISVDYKPRLEGEHLLSITTKSDGEHIQGSPFRFYVFNPSSKNTAVTATGEGLVHGIAGETATFKVHIPKSCGVGGLRVSIEGPGKSIIDNQDDGDTVTVNYIPPIPGEYRISILFADKPISGSPFCPHVTGEGKQRSAISVSGSSEIKLKINETFSKEDKLVATIITPSGTEENCYLKRIAETGHLLISFTPEQSGEHLIIVTKNGQPVFGSPFKINVLPTEIGNAGLVKLTGTGHKYGKTMTENTFNIDTRQAGYGAISLSIEGPSKCEISSTEVEPGLIKITYKTKTPGYYLMNLKFADQHVNGSPFTIEVTGASEQFQRETQKLQTRSVEDQQIGSVCKMSCTITQTISKQKLKSFVTTPSGQRKEAVLKQTINQTGSTHVVEFTATEIGEHTIEIIEETTNKNIPGFPIKYQVGKLKEDGGNSSVRAVGPGLEGGVVGQKGEFNIYTRAAGSGSLSITMEGPGKAILDIKEIQDELNFNASYLVDKPGEYRLAIKYADKHIPDSPFRIWVMPEQDLAKRIVLEGLQSKTAVQNKTLTMKVQLNGALKLKTTTTTKEEKTTTTTTTTKSTTKSSQDNELIAKLVSPSGKEEDIFLTEIDENECVLSFKCRELGPNVVNVRLNGVHVSNSPCNFFVREKKTQTKKEETSTKKTTSTNENVTNTSTNTSQATDNAKTVDKSSTQQDSTSKSTTVTEKTSIEEKITTITCTKTQVKIDGLSREIKSGQENVFIVNTQNAPAGKLNVKIDGPHKADIKLALCDEGYKVSYKVNGPGKYFVQGKYNGQDITGFPYELVCDGQTNTKRDLGEVKV